MWSLTIRTESIQNMNYFLPLLTVFVIQGKILRRYGLLSSNVVNIQHFTTNFILIVSLQKYIRRFSQYNCIHLIQFIKISLKTSLPEIKEKKKPAGRFDNSPSQS